VTHRATVELAFDRPAAARTIERALAPEVGAIDDDRSRTRLERDGATLSVVIDADDPTALRAAKNTWFSLLVAFLIVAGLGVGFLLLIPFFILGVPESNGLTLPTVIFVLIAVVGVVPYAAYTQFLYPVIITDGIGAIEAIYMSARTVNDDTRTVFGFTVTKLVLAYVPFLIGIRGALQLGQDTISEALTYYIDLGADPSSSPTLLEIIVDRSDPSTIAAMAILFLIGAVVREFV